MTKRAKAKTTIGGVKKSAQMVAFAASDPGRRRLRNEDSFLMDVERGVFAVADGMGGHQGGATASRIAMEAVASEARGTLSDRLGEAAFAARVVTVVDHSQDDFQDDFSSAHSGTEPAISTVFSPELAMMRNVAKVASQQIFAASQRAEELRGMGTTLTAMVIERIGQQLFAHVVHAGDSRLYRLGKDGVIQVTEDHTWIAEQTKRGLLSEEEAQRSKYRHVITKSIGFERLIDVDALTIEFAPGDILLLCSDGFSNYIDLDELATELTKFSLSQTPAHLVALANERGGEDNITVLVVQVEG
jgi:serine/threonine protein phosphatase PrpC